MNKVRVGFLGCGGYMHVHAERLKANPKAQIAALCDVEQSNIDRLASNRLADYTPAPAQFSDPAAMYREAKLDAVFIATPHTMHYQHGVQALEAGCHVYMEKPMVTSAEDAYKLKALADQKKKIVVVGYNTPCSPEFNYIRQTIRTKALGKLELVIGHLSQNWRRATKGRWRQDPKLSGGGQAYDSGAHLLNSLVWTVESNIAEVFAFVDNMDTEVDINSSINIRFENGVLASIVVGGNCTASGAHMAYMFDNGKIEVDPWIASWMNVYEGTTRVKYPVVPGKDMTPDDNFIDACLGLDEPRTSPVNGIIQSELMDAIYESARTGKPARPKSRG